MKLEVGMYARTIDNGIGKVDDIIGDTVVVDICDGATTYQMEHIRDYNFKYGYNIIDLIEVGDYVNDEKVVWKSEGTSKCIQTEHSDINLIYEKDIKSIVTKEQFEAIKYKVGE